MPTGFLSVCNGKRKRKPTEKGEELHNALERVNPSTPHSRTVTPKKANPAQELAVKEKQLKIALLKNRLELLRARQSVLAAAQPSLSTPSTPSVTIPENLPRLGKRVIRPVTRDLPPSPERTKPRRIKPKTPKRPEEKANGAASPPKKRGQKGNPDLEKQLADLNATMMTLTKQLANQKPAAERAPKLPKNATPLTNREKQALKTDIFKLPADKVNPIIEMCANRGVEDKGEDSVTIDIEKLEIPVLRELQKYVKKCLNQMNRKKGGAQKDQPTLNVPLTTPVPSPSPSLQQPTTPRQPLSRKSDSESGDSSSSEDSDSESEAEFKAPSSTPQLPRTPNLAQTYDWEGAHAPEPAHKELEGQQFYELMDSLG